LKPASVRYSTSRTSWRRPGPSPASSWVGMERVHPVAVIWPAHWTTANSYWRCPRRAPWWSSRSTASVRRAIRPRRGNPGRPCASCSIRLATRTFKFLTSTFKTGEIVGRPVTNPIHYDNLRPRLGPMLGELTVRRIRYLRYLAIVVSASCAHAPGASSSSPERAEEDARAPAAPVLASPAAEAGKKEGSWEIWLCSGNCAQASIPATCDLFDWRDRSTAKVRILARPKRCTTVGETRITLAVPNGPNVGGKVYPNLTMPEGSDTELQTDHIQIADTTTHLQYVVHAFCSEPAGEPASGRGICRVR
jgi:hypothetical protein